MDVTREQAWALLTEHTKNPNLIMVTSALPGEGKTFNAINLAMSIAKERDLHVLRWHWPRCKCTSSVHRGPHADCRGTR